MQKQDLTEYRFSQILLLHQTGVRPLQLIYAFCQPSRRRKINTEEAHSTAEGLRDDLLICSLLTSTLNGFLNFNDWR